MVGMPDAHAHHPHVPADPRQQLGLDGEAAARAALRSHGYVILAERYRICYGEVDIVARDDQTIVFIEVKTRRADAYGGGAAAVTWRKQRTIVRVAEAFIARGRLGISLAASTWWSGRRARTPRRDHPRRLRRTLGSATAVVRSPIPDPRSPIPDPRSR